MNAIERSLLLDQQFHFYYGFGEKIYDFIYLEINLILYLSLSLLLSFWQVG